MYLLKLTVRLVNIEMELFFEFDRHTNSLQRDLILAFAGKSSVCKTALTFISTTKYETEKKKQKIEMGENYWNRKKKCL